MCGRDGGLMQLNLSLTSYQGPGGPLKPLEQREFAVYLANLSPEGSPFLTLPFTLPPSYVFAFLHCAVLYVRLSSSKWRLLIDCIGLGDFVSMSDGNVRACPR